MSNTFLIGEKVCWSIGREDNPILLRGLYIEKTNSTESKVLCYEQNGQRRNIELKVLTELLKRD